MAARNHTKQSAATRAKIAASMKAAHARKKVIGWTRKEEDNLRAEISPQLERLVDDTRATRESSHTILTIDKDGIVRTLMPADVWPDREGTVAYKINDILVTVKKG